MPRSNSGSGAATASGITFQENVAAWLVCQILAGPNRTNDLELSADIVLESITCESLQPIDDIVISATDRKLFFQCKTTLSVGANSEFVKVMEQFAEQFLQSGHPDDRYVLAVSDSASALLRTSLREVLRLIRGKRGEQRARELQNIDQVTREKYETFEQSARDQLQRFQTGITVENEQVFSLIDRIMIYAAPFGGGACIPDAATDKLALVLTKPEDANRAWEHIVSLVRGFSPRRTGGDRDRFVQNLRAEGFIAKPLARVREAIALLQASSRDYLSQLAKHALIQCGPEERVPINRPIVEKIYQELQQGNLLLSGEAGAGKTGCLVQVAHRLQLDNVPLLVIPIERAFIGSAPYPSTLLPAGVSLEEVLGGWPTDRPGVVCLDGLDAARSSISLRSVLDFVYQVQTVAPNWRVLASIREYDLQESDEIRRLFTKAVPGAVPTSSIAGVRNVRITELTDEEIEQLYSRVPTLQDALGPSGAADVKSLVRNIFNLDLFVDLLVSSDDPSELRQIDTQDKLLQVYWRKRVEEASKSTDAIAKLTRRMVDGRCVSLRVGSEITAGLAELFSNSVLTREPGLLPEDPELVRYRHNILFDYAVSRLWLKGLNDPEVRAELANSPDLALVFRPSLRMTLQRLWQADSTRKSFWTRVAMWSNAEGMNDICKLLVTQVAAEEFREVRDVASLLDQLKDPVIADLLQGTVTTALLLLRVDREAFDIVGPAAAAWLPLIEILADREASRFSHLLRNVLVAVLVGSPDGRDKLTSEQRSSFAFIASRLLDVYLSDASGDVIRRELLGVAVQACIFAAHWNSDDSIVSLKRALAPSIIAKAGFVVLPPLGDEIIALARIDEQFVEHVFASYAAMPEPDRDQLTSMGSGSILTLTSNAQQDFSMFEYSVGEVFDQLVESHPELAARVLRLIVRRHLDYRESNVTEPLSNRTTEFEFGGRTRSYIRDYCYIWDASQAHSRHELWSKAADTVFNCLKKESTDELLRTSLFNAILAMADTGAIWNRLLLAAVELPIPFSAQLAPLLTHSVFLQEFETRHAVGKLLESRFATWEVNERKQVELAILRMARNVDDLTNKSQEALQRARDSLIVCLPKEAIVTEQVRAISDRLHSQQATSPPTIPFRFGKIGFISDEDDLREKGYLRTENQRRFFDLREKIIRLGRSNESIRVGDVPRALEMISVYEEALATAERDEIAAEQTEFSDGEIAAVFSALAAVEGLESGQRDVILQRLLTFSAHTDPKYLMENEDCWDGESPYWGSPFPRIEAARGLMKFVRTSKTIDESTQAVILRLADDPAAAVRYQIIADVGSLYLLVPEFFWKLIEKQVEAENRLALLQCVIVVLLGFSPKDEHANRVDRLIRRIESRLEHRKEAGFVRKTMVVHYLRRAIYVGDRDAESWLEAIITSPSSFPKELQELLRLWQELLSEPRATGVLSEDELVARGIEVLSRAFDMSYTTWDQKPWEGLDHDEAREVFHRTVGPMQQVVDTTSLLLDRRSHPMDPAPRHDHARINQIVKTFRPLIEMCTKVPLATEAYTLLRTLQYISPVIPGEALLWVRTLIRAAAKQGFLNDSMGVDLLIDLLERYLVEHRDLLSNDAKVRNAMIELLNDCARNGWPKAAPLLVRLHEVFRA